MKFRKWICPILIVLCVMVLLGYRAVNRMSADTQPPVIHVAEQELQLSVADAQELLLLGMVALDETDGNVTDSLVIEKIRLLNTDGTVMVTYAAFDSAGNVAKAQRQVRYTDYASPHFRLSQPLLFQLGSNMDVLDVIRAEDPLEGDISHRIRAINLTGTSLSMQGSYQIQFQVSNSLGDMVQLEIPVEVYAPGTYDAKLALTDYLIYLPVGETFAPEQYLLEYRYGTQTVSLAEGLPENYYLQLVGAVDTATPGIYELGYKVTHTVGTGANASIHTGYSKLIVIVEG